MGTGGWGADSEAAFLRGSHLDSWGKKSPQCRGKYCLGQHCIDWVIPALGRWRQEKFKVIFDYLRSSRQPETEEALKHNNNRSNLWKPQVFIEKHNPFSSLSAFVSILLIHSKEFFCDSFHTCTECILFCQRQDFSIIFLWLAWNLVQSRLDLNSPLPLFPGCDDLRCTSRRSVYLTIFWSHSPYDPLLFLSPCLPDPLPPSNASPFYCHVFLYTVFSRNQNVKLKGSLAQRWNVLFFVHLGTPSPRRTPNSFSIHSSSQNCCSIKPVPDPQLMY